MLKLTYTRERDEFQTVAVIWDAEVVRDLYRQLTHNYRTQDGTKIGSIGVTDLDGFDCTEEVIARPHAVSTRMSKLFS